MGYYTNYHIETKNDPNKYGITRLIEKSGYDFDGSTCESIKWYSWKEDLEYVSKAYPEVTFIVSGVGEEYPDIWRAWARGGRVELVIARIEFSEPFWV